MHRNLFLLLCSLIVVDCIAQSNWARRVGVWSNDAYNAIVVDAAGNSYVTGEFGGTIPLGSNLLMSQGSLDIVVAKYSASGNLIWVKTFGGSGLDRGIALALGPSGELVVTGQFMGTAQFGSEVLVSQGGTQDVFVLSMQASDGSMQWVRQGGGADGVDQPNDVSVGPDGSIAVTGEFRGTAVFDAGTITSMTDPQTSLPSVDIFVAAYAADGTTLWLKQGTAKYADRGMAVDHDLLGNVYVTGQFSDTITFDQTHVNQMFSAIFIVRFNSAGEEEWFRRFGGGTYNQVFDIAVVDDSYLLLTGDLQGTVIFLDDQPDLFTAVAPRSSFLVEVDLSGQFIRQTTWGSEHVLNTRSLAVRGDEYAVFGRFQCQFTGFSALYGDGTWLATGEHDLYIARFERSDLSLKEAQQFGGQRNKVPGGIEYLPDGAPVFCGSFDRLLVFPSSPFQFNTQPVINTVLAAPVPGSFCDDANYGSYVGLRGNALMDAFIARGWVEGRQPYDVFTRPAGDCDRPQRDAYIRMNGQGAVGPDTLRACLHADLVAYTHTAFTADTSMRHTAPAFNFQWSTGNDSAAIHVHDGGWYHVTITGPGGCWVRTDSLYVIIDPLPGIPVVSDDVVVNVAALSPSSITVCEPLQPWLWSDFIAPEDSVSWTGPPGFVAGDSIQATMSGLYIVTVTSPQGCQRNNQVLVQILPAGPLPPLEAEYVVTFPQDTDLNDTVSICANMPLTYRTTVQLMLDGQPVPLPYGVRMLRNCNHAGWSQVSPNPDMVVSCTSWISTEGWYTYDLGIMLTNAPCGEDTLIFWNTGSIYVIPFPVTQPTVSVTGPAHLCPGDTATVVMNCTNCEQVSWAGPGIVQNFTDSLWVSNPGNFSAYVTHLDTNGCNTSASDSHLIQWNPRPLLGVIPIDGIICPDSSATIFSDTQGTEYQWYGPLGPLSVDNDTIITSQQGLYYLEMLDLTGCPVTSDPILVTDYATPFLNVLPDNTLCLPGETATLQVVTTGEPSLQWQWPLSGNALQQVVNQPGVYTCAVSACNITTMLSVEIFGNGAVAALIEQPPVEPCGDDEILLQAAPGMTLYYWLPGPVIGPQLLVTTSGTYTLVAVDQNGCEASTQTTIEFQEWTVPLTASGAVVCAGSPVELTAEGGGTITWYAGPDLDEVIATGSVLDLGVPLESITFHVQQVEGACASNVQEVVVEVLPVPEPPVVIGPDSLCIGSTAVLYVVPQPGVSFVWTTPLGQVNGNSIELDEVSFDDAGIYTVTASNAVCASTASEHAVVVLAPQSLSLGPDTMICPGGEVSFILPDGFSNAVWNGSIGGEIYTTSIPGLVSLSALDGNGCAVSSSAMVSLFAFTVPVIAQPVEICFGSDAMLEAVGSGTFSWYADEALQQSLGDGPSLLVSQPSDSVVYFVVQEEWMCLSAPVAVPLNVSPIPLNVQIEGPEVVCAGTAIVLTLVGEPNASGAWTMPSGTALGSQVTIAPATPNDAGLYMVATSIGPCLGDTLSWVVDVLIPFIPDMGPDTTFCEGGQYYIEVPPGFLDPLWTTGSTAYGIIVTTPGTYGVTVTDAQGCSSYGEIDLEEIHCDLQLPNVITPNGDGANDVWSLPPGSFLTASMQIFDRYGSVVWEGDPSRNAFRGLHYLNAEPLTDGVYFFVLAIQRSNGQQVEQRGYIQLVR